MKAKARGFSGEAMAAHYLQTKGYEVVATNFTVRGGEIDLVARHGELLIFVEVKTRTGVGFGSGDESIGYTKRRHLQNAIERYLYEAGMSDADYRVDVIEVDIDLESGTLKNITHHEDIEL